VTVLANMSLKPRTEARFETGAVAGVLVRFALDAKARRALRERTRSRRDAPSLRAELEAAWQAAGLRGAALVYQGVPQLPVQLELGAPRATAPTRRLAATDGALVTNVVGRTRGFLLLPGMPLELGDAFLSRTIWSDDPRLVALAQRSGVEEIP
jgi:hypothetical protein